MVFTGAGNDAFAAGADIKELRETSGLDILLNPKIQNVYNKIESFEKLTIARINGYALGGGFELALACDIRIAAENAKVGLSELNLGIVPGAGGTQRLARLIPKGKALELILTGKILKAEEAYTMGLLTDCVAKVELDQQYLTS
ncbi:enoyl-CoA hydratase/isomerase family protein [Evansella halocellulosilytica]|uniref:enoyl-CoA hydratase/isomerase family protein n=1 Tax=Evansella halocellulosilytica TaxID=2011013 RepID=UPI0027B8FCF0|nr:enoyl-CoA hydratase/isomerase family protein [Evansella halocellulosilytica]